MHQQSLYHRGLSEAAAAAGLHQATLPPLNNHLQKPLISALPFHSKPILDSLPIYNLFPLIGLRPQITNPNWNSMFQQQTLAYIQGLKKVGRLWIIILSKALQQQQQQQQQHQKDQSTLGTDNEDSVSVSSMDHKGTEQTSSETRKGRKRRASDELQWKPSLRDEAEIEGRDGSSPKEEQAEPLDLSWKRPCER